MANTIKVLFWLRRNKVNKDGLVPLMTRLTYLNERCDKATGYYVNTKQWNSSKQLLRGNDKDAVALNNWIRNSTIKLELIFKERADSDALHLPSILDTLFAKVKEEPTILKLMDDFNKNLNLRVGKDFTHSTYEKYVFTYDKVEAFIQKQFRKKDILLREINLKFIMDFDHYLRVNDNNQHNTAIKYCINLKRIFNVAVMQGVLKVNPFNGFKTVYKDTPQVYLSEAEVKTLEKMRLVLKNHLLVRDLFLFQCYTGLAYTDMVNLELKDITIDSSGNKWIFKPRQKTGINSTIPLLPNALRLIAKYSDKNRTLLFPRYSIQKFNQYIGDVGVLAKINKKLSSHVGRRTFGNVALSKGVSLNVISKILGHSNTLITQRIYAITTQNIISAEIKKLQ